MLLLFISMLAAGQQKDGNVRSEKDDEAVGKEEEALPEGDGEGENNNTANATAQTQTTTAATSPSASTTSSGLTIFSTESLVFSIALANSLILIEFVFSPITS